MKASYALNNFNKALRMLKPGELEKRKWLCSKYVAHLCQLELTDMPGELRQEFIRFRQDMKLIEADCRAGTPKMTVHALAGSQIDDLIARILAMREVCERSQLPQ